jgi:hypothetical protein
LSRRHGSARVERASHDHRPRGHDAASKPAPSRPHHPRCTLKPAAPLTGRLCVRLRAGNRNKCGVGPPLGGVPHYPEGQARLERLGRGAGHSTGRLPGGVGAECSLSSRAAAIRLHTPSRTKIDLTWNLTVFTVMNRRVAISS